MEEGKLYELISRYLAGEILPDAVIEEFKDFDAKKPGKISCPN